jgi:restriction endonuclease S subunit
MIAYSIIQKSQLEGALRLDAEYYQPEYLELDKKILGFGKYYNFGELIEVFNAGINWPQISKDNIKFLRTQHIRDILIRDEEDLTFCNGKPPEKLLLKEGDLLFTRVGGVSDNSVVSKAYEGHFYSDNVLRIRIKNLNPYFVSVFFNSKYGKTQLERVMKGIAQPLISRGNFERIKIINPLIDSQKEIEKLVKKSYQLRDSSISFYSQAEDLLLGELGMKDFEIKDDLSYIINLSEVKSIHRSDAEYFQPKYEKLISKIKKQKPKLLGNLVSIKKGIEIGSEQYQEEGKLFVRVSNLSRQGLIEKDQKYLSEELYQKLKKDFEPKIGEILLTKDATPGIAYVLKEAVEGIIAGGILRLKLNSDIEPEYLTLVINSIVGQMQVERDTGGSVIVHWRPDQIKSCLIPILPKSTQQKIADSVQKSHETRQKAKELLEQAKQKVEELISN